MPSTVKPRCIFCGNDRPADLPTCPSCGRPWIDERVDAHDMAAEGAADPSMPPLYPSIDHETPAAYPTPPSRARRRGLSVAIGAVLAVGVVAVIAVAALSDDDDGTSPAAPTTPAVTTEAPSEPSTTAALPTTTTDATTTTTTTTTTTPTTTPTTLPPIDAVGDPIPLSALSLGAFALGPLEFGAVDVDALGRLVATFGQPDRIAPATPDDGLCAGDIGTVAAWGPLEAIFLGTEDARVLAGYRLGPVTSETADHPAADLETLSGLTLGDTNGIAEALYVAPTIDFVELDGRLVFRVLRSSDSRTLLWGPVTSAERDGVIEGLRSPRPCDGGP